jgi:cystathionine gamma-lyase
MPPIHQSSTYAQSSPGQHQGYEYSRTKNPTRTALETCLASLEGGGHGFAFASGCAATTAVAHLLEAGDRVVAGDDLYGGTHRLFDGVLAELGISFEYVDMTDLSNLEAALEEPTDLVWMETPTNPNLKVFDIEGVAELAHNMQDAMVAVDNTFLSPYFQTPLDHGADLVVHSTTKFINGHSDVVGGAVIVDDDALAEDLHFLQNSVGAVPGPMDAWLVMRGVKTLPLRMRQHAQNATAVAEMLQAHDHVRSVTFPGLDSHPQSDLVDKQMTGPGGVVTFRLDGGLDEARSFLESVEVFTLAESLGGVESLIEHPAIMTHASVPADKRRELGITDDMVRISVGVETQQDLLDDLDQALLAM